MNTSLDLYKIPALYLNIYFALVIIIGVVAIRNVKFNLLTCVIIFIFFEGVFKYFGNLAENAHKIIILILLVISFISKGGIGKAIKRENAIVFFSFFIFTLFFTISSYLNDVSVVLTLSHYSKFLIPFLFFFIIKKQFPSILQLNYFAKLFVLLISLQVIYSVLKLFIIGFNEAIIGSVAFTGGSVATLLPILGFMLFWYYKRTSLSNREWLISLSFLIIAIASNKRAIWFIMPIVIFFLYSNKRAIGKKILLIIPLIPAIFYFGVRLNPSLNREFKIWGSFDIEYVVKYVVDYNIGDENRRGTGFGRVGGNMVLFNKAIQAPSDINNLFGYGLDEVYTKSYSEFEFDKFDIAGKASTTGMGSFFIATGIGGALSILWFMYTIINTMRDKTKWILFGVFCWDYIFYSGAILASKALFILFIFIVIYYNELGKTQQFQKNSLSRKNRI